MKASNAVIVVVVAAVVAAVAWFRAARQGAGVGLPTPAAPPAVTSPTASPATAPAREGELCAEPPPAPPAGKAPTSGPNVTAGSPAVTKKLPRVVDLGAAKCKACKELAPILEELRKEYEGRVIVEFIDVWKNPRAGVPYKIRVIPTQVFFDADGKEIWRHEGFLPKEEFVKKFVELGVK